MKRKPTIVYLLLAVILICSPQAIAQQPVAPDNWSAVQEAPPGDEIVITLKDGKSFKGKLSNVSRDELSIVRKNKNESIRKDNIAQVYRVKRKAQKGKYAAIGGAVGAGAGLGIETAPGTDLINGLSRRLSFQSFEVNRVGSAIAPPISPLPATTLSLVTFLSCS